MAKASFSIHQDLWQEAWLAGTASVRGRKGFAQANLNVRKRIAQLFEDHGPRSEMPLTLRVYGTLMKGFSVINNDRARALHGDCERAVFLFSQQPDEEKGGKLTSGKRQRVDALSLDLDIAKVKESETFDWTQAPLDESTLQPLLALQEGAFNFDAAFASAPSATMVGGGAIVLASSASSLVLHDPLLEEAFPALEAPRGGDDTCEDAAAAMPAAAAAAAALPIMEAAAPVTPQAVGAPMTPTGRSGEQQLAVGGEVVLATPPKRRRFLKGVPRPPIPGYVFGFDEHTFLSLEVCEEWQSNEGPISEEYRTPLDYADEYVDEAAVDHLGPLRLFLNPPSTVLFGPDAVGIDFAGAEQQVDPGAEQWPKDGKRVGAPDNAATPKGKRTKVRHAADDVFRPYDPDSPLRSGAVSELAGLLGGPPGLDDGAVIDGADEAEPGEAAAYDSHTAAVGAVFSRIVEEGSQKGKQVTMDALAPVGSTDRATAARTFHALLTLATAGHFAVEQSMPYGLIAVSAA